MGKKSIGDIIAFGYQVSKVNDLDIIINIIL